MMLPIHVAAEKYPNELAYDDGEDRITYRELKGILAESDIMRLQNLRPADHIAWCPQNCKESFLTFWALLQRGCIVCPVSHRFPDAVREEIVKQIDASWLYDLVDDQQFRSTKKRAEVTEGDQQSPATLILSSGSTGFPKAVVHSMRAHEANAMGAAINMPLGPGDRWLWSLPLYHISGLSILVRCAVAGATVIGMPKESRLSAHILREQRVSHLSVVSTQLRQLMSEDSSTLNKLKFVLLGGSAVDATTVVEARANGIRVVTTYGLTEMASQVTTSKVASDPESSGRLLANRQLKISSDGEILVRGETLCLGYYQSQEIRPVIDENGWFHTRDLGVLNDFGQLFVHGRIDNMFISGGENIFPEKIERIILSSFDIDQAIVVPQADEKFGWRPVVFVDGVLPHDWRCILKSQLAGYEIPIESHPWPFRDKDVVKVDRIMMKQLVADKSK